MIGIVRAAQSIETLFEALLACEVACQRSELIPDIISAARDLEGLALAERKEVLCGFRLV